VVDGKLIPYRSVDVYSTTYVECEVRGVRCRAREAHLGGIVVEPVATMESPKLIFTMSLEDWLAFQNHYMKTSARYRDAIFEWQWFFAILLGSIVAYVFSDVSPEVGLGGGFGVLVLTAILSPRVIRRNNLAASRTELSKKKLGPLFAGQRTLEIGDEGLLAESAVGSQLLRWWFIESVDETDAHVGIFPAIGPIFVIPKAAVNPEVLKSFLSELRGRLRKPVSNQS
jgi:hypothetical protein